MKRVLSLLLSLTMIISVFVVVPTTVEATEDYRAWAQKDSRWSSIRLGSSSYTIGSDGCLVSSITKLIIQAGFRSPDSFNIGTLANWLNSNGGYTSGGLLYWARPSACVSGFNYYGNLLDYGTYNSSTYNSQLISWVNSGYHITLQVSNGNHWIAIDEAKTKATGEVYIMDSSDGINADLTLTSRYGTFNSAVAYTGGTSPNLDPDTHYGAEIVNFDGTNASNISFFNATIGCWMRNPNSYNIRAYGFYLGNNQNDLVQYTIGQNVRWTDSYIQANLSDYVGRLSQGVQYYYRFFSLTDGYNLSPIYSFTTTGNSTVTFDNIASSNTDNDNLSIECWVRNPQGLNIIKYGFYYGTSVNGMNECIEVGNNVSWTDFHISTKLIDQNIELKPNTTYYYQFFALTDGWNFSPVSSFTTGNNNYGNNPTSCLDAVDGGVGSVHVTGWAFDKDDLTQSLAVHVYIGGSSSTLGAECVEITANVSRKDVDNAHHIGEFHGFDATIPTSKTGIQDVYVYAINIGSGENKEIGHGTVYIESNTQNPTSPTEPPTVAKILLGDADGDGEVTILDATVIQRRLASLPTRAYNEKAADADGDGEVTILDATAIQRHLANLPTNERIGTLI